MVARKRFFTRHPIVLKVRVRSSSGWIDTISDDVSRRGLFLRTNQPIPMGRIAQMEIMLPSGKKFEAMGHVRRTVTEASPSDPAPGMGVEFFVMAKEAQDAWDMLVIERKRAGAARLEESHEMPHGHRAVPPPLPGFTDHDETAEAGLPAFLRESTPEVEEDVVAAPEEAPAVEEPAPMPAEAHGTAWDAHVAPDDPPQAPKPPAEAPVVLSMRDTLADSHGRKIPADLARIIEAARDAAAGHDDEPDTGGVSAPTAAKATESVKRDTLITVQPSTSGRLSHFIDRKMRGSNVFLRTSVQCGVGERVNLAIVHPETDIELMIDGHVRKLVDSDAVSGVLLGFDAPNPDERARLQHFVVTGQPKVADITAPSQRLEALEDAVAADRDSAAAHRNLGFGLLTISEQPDRAVAAFLDSLALDATALETHYGLAVAYALGGDGIKSYAFLRSARSIAGDTSS